MKTSSESLKQLQDLYQSNEKQALQEFFTFLEFESISSEPGHEADIQACITWLQNYVTKLGFTTELWPTTGHPVLYAQWNGAGKDKPTLLIYNHYDVQPSTPLELWESPPFSPTVRNGEVFARGAQDNKGQCFYVLQALKLLMTKNGTFPLNIKLCIEGEEECGSHGLANILKEKSEQLRADYLAIVDLGMKAPNCPTLTLGLRGIVTMDVELTGSNVDLHSGSHGGLAYNPLHALVEMLAKLRDPNGKIAIPGFYDNVVNFTEDEKQRFTMDFDHENYETMFGAKCSGGERTLLPRERNWFRPALEINGLWGGYTGAGFKTVIPAKAYAKLSCRLVPRQEPQAVGRQIAEFLQSQAPEGIDVAVHIHEGGGLACQTKACSKSISAFAQALEEVYGKQCIFISSGASIPIATDLAAASHSEMILLGLGLTDDNIHAPNEHFGIDRLQQGALMMARGIELLAQQ